MKPHDRAFPVPGNNQQRGMSFRDYAAVQIMAAQIAHPDMAINEFEAVSYADDLCRALQKRPEAR